MARPAKVPALAPVQPSRAIVTHPVSIFELAPSVHADLAPRLRALAADVPRVMADPERVARALEKASVPCLLLIEALVGAGGQLPRETLLELLHARFGWDAKASSEALNEAADACLLVSMSVGRVGSLAVSWFVLLLEETAEQLAEATWGLSLPAVPEALARQPLPVARVLQAQRDRLARLAGLIHFGVRANKAGTAANRTSLKKLAVVTQKTDVLLAEEVAEALAERILRTDGDLIVPDRARLEALADGRLVWGSPAVGLDAWIPSDRWVSEEALVRAFVLTQRMDLALPIWMRPWDYLAHGTLELARARASLAYCTAHRVVVDGHCFLRRAAPRESTGDGHVTASLEVMLGPEATLDVVLNVALMAEPLRFDTVLTFKLTQASISSAVALGLDAASMIETLERVGRHGIPANVRAMVEDWTRSARSARIRAVWSIELSSAETADVVARTLGNRVVARPLPTLLLVDHALTAPEVALAKLGVKSSLAASSSPVQEATHPYALGPHPARDQRPSAAWLAKVEKAQKDGLRLAPSPGTA